MENRLKEIREEKGMTQEELAEQISVVPIRIEEWEEGKVRLPLEFALKARVVLGCTLEELSGKNPPKGKPLQRG